MYGILQRFQPFGPGNMAPVFISKEVSDTGYGKVVGKNHLRLTVTHPRPPYNGYGCIGFNLGDKVGLVGKGKLMEVAYTIEENEFNGRVSLQLNIKDLRSMPFS